MLRALPDRLDVTDKGPWKYSHSFDEVPGSIKIVEIEKSNGMEFRQEYFADGVRPKGIGVLADILRKAFAEVSVTDISPAQILN